jgi:hypothetical protein
VLAVQIRASQAGVTAEQVNYSVMQKSDPGVLIFLKMA